MSNFGLFLRFMWPEMTKARPQLVEAANRLDAFWNNGKTGDVINISMPTRFGKSVLATTLSTWLLLNDFNTRILRASYAADLAESFSNQVKTQFISFFEKCGQQPPTISGTRARWRIGDSNQDNHIGIGIGGGATGFGCDIAIIDDTAKNMLEATSAAYTRQLNDFKESVLIGRLEGKRKIVNVGTRWTVNDWFSYWPDAEEFILPALVDGRSVCEDWKTTAELEREKERVSISVWNAQYMQRPTETGKVRLFEGFNPQYALPDSNKHVIIIDPSTDFGTDYFVMGDYIYDKGFIYLVDIFAQQAISPEKAAEWLKSKEYSVAWCETNGVGRKVMDKMRKAGCKNMAGFSTQSDKYSRAYIQAEAIHNYFRIVPHCNEEAVRELLHQADVFPVTGEDIHDDLIDNVVMAFEKLYRV